MLQKWNTFWNKKSFIYTKDGVLTAAEQETLNSTLKMEAASSSEMLVSTYKLLGTTFQKTVIFTHVTLMSTFRNIKDYVIITNFKRYILLFHIIYIWQSNLKPTRVEHYFEGYEN